MSAVSRHRAPWSPAEVKQLESMWSQHSGLPAIAVQLGRTEKAVEAKIQAIRRQRDGPKAGKQLRRRSNGALFFLS